MTQQVQLARPPAPGTIASAARSHTGRRRANNEDRSLSANGVYAVADGVGGAPAGEVAATFAIAELAGTAMPADEEALAEVLRRANRRIHAICEADPALGGMSTTFTAAAVNADRVLLAHVGDSRAYRLRDGRLQPLTRDHSFQEELTGRGLDPETALNGRFRGLLTRALGVLPEVAVDSSAHAARPGDLYLLCTDGLTSAVSDQRLAQVLDADGGLRHMADQLIEGALRAGAPDNVTVVLFRLPQGQGAA